MFGFGGYCDGLDSSTIRVSVCRGLLSWLWSALPPLTPTRPLQGHRGSGAAIRIGIWNGARSSMFTIYRTPGAVLRPGRSPRTFARVQPSVRRLGCLVQRSKTTGTTRTRPRATQKVAQMLLRPMIPVFMESIRFMTSTGTWVIRSPAAPASFRPSTTPGTLAERRKRVPKTFPALPRGVFQQVLAHC